MVVNKKALLSLAKVGITASFIAFSTGSFSVEEPKVESSQVEEAPNASKTGTSKKAANQSATLAEQENAGKLLVDRIKNYQHLSGKFEQVTIDGSGRQVQEMTGDFKLQKPGKFWWKVAKPYEQEITTDGETLWLYDADLFQVTEQPVSKDLTSTPALLFTGDTKQIEDSYEVEVVKENQVERFVLIPKKPDSLFEILRITFFQTVLKEMSIEDSLGQKTLIRFKALDNKTAIDPKQFIFEIPEGVDVIKQGE